MEYVLKRRTELALVASVSSRIEVGRAERKMWTVTHIAWMSLLYVKSAAKDQRFPCYDLIVEVKTEVRGPPDKNTWCRVNFNLFDVSGHLSPDGGPQVWTGHFRAKDASVETKICRNQAAALADIISKNGLAGKTVTMFFILFISNETRTAYVRIEQEVFAVRPDGKLEYCYLRKGNGRRFDTVRARGEYGNLLASTEDVEGMRHRWLEMCLTTDHRNERATQVKRMGFWCENASESEGPSEATTTGRTTADDTTREEQTTTGETRETTDGRRDGETESTDRQMEEGDVGRTGQVSATGSVVGAVIGTVAAIGGIAGSVWLWKSRGEGR